MYEQLSIHQTTDMHCFCAAPDLPVLDPFQIRRQQADAHWLVTDSRRRVYARCSLWWRSVPAYAGERVGVIGHYAATTSETADYLLSVACGQLAAEGCTLAIGPMDGSIWQRHRLVIERGSEPAFFMEPDNPDDWPRHFWNNEFTPLAHYVSAINQNIHHRRERGARTLARLASRGIRLRRLEPVEVALAEQFAALMRTIYRVATAAFQQNVLYSPISEDEFIAQYAPFRSYIRPELVLLAEDRGQTIGFVFALPDMLQIRRGQATDTIVIETVAVLPKYAGQGIGALLVDRCQQAAARLGYRRAIHALLPEATSTPMLNIPDCQPMRRYALFAKRLSDR
jgi:GNAT superfamily N-acetyltransferase